ncbi:Multidrug resistance protein MdtA precursor [compost metagenome]
MPAAAVQFGSSGTFVYVVDADNKVKVRPIAVTASNGEQSLIGEGLAAGEKVVLEGTDRLREGSTVEVVEGAFKEATPPVAPAPAANPRGERPADAAPARKPAA